MGILSWWGGKKEAPSSSGSKPTQKPVPKDKPLPQQSEVPGMNGAVEVIRSGVPPPDVTVFEFGSVATSTDKVTLAGYPTSSNPAAGRSYRPVATMLLSFAWSSERGQKLLPKIVRNFGDLAMSLTE